MRLPCCTYAPSIDGAQPQSEASIVTADIATQRREGVFDLVVFNRMAVAQDLGYQRPQLGDVPLAVAQVVDEAALRFFFGDMEVPEESGVGRADPQALVEDHERLSQGHNDVLGVGESLFQFMCALVKVRFHLALPLLPFSEADPSMERLSQANFIEGGHLREVVA